MFRYSSGISNKTSNQWDYDIWFGRCTQSDEHFVTTGDQVYRNRSIRRLHMVDRYQKELLEKINAVPWTTRGVGKSEEPFILPRGLQGLLSGPLHRHQADKSDENDVKEPGVTTIPPPPGLPAGVKREGSEGTTKEEPNDKKVKGEVTTGAKHGHGDSVSDQWPKKAKTPEGADYCHYYIEHPKYYYEGHGTARGTWTKLQKGQDQLGGWHDIDEDPQGHYFTGKDS